MAKQVTPSHIIESNMFCEKPRIWYARSEGESTAQCSMKDFDELDDTIQNLFLKGLIMDWRALEFRQFPGEMMGLATQMKWRLPTNIVLGILANESSQDHINHLVKYLCNFNISACNVKKWADLAGLFNMGDLPNDPAGESSDLNDDDGSLLL